MYFYTVILTQIKEKTYLGPEGTFVTDEEYPKFVRQELIVNAVTHRAYSITGTDIQIKMFDDHIVIEEVKAIRTFINNEKSNWYYIGTKKVVNEME